MAYTTVLTFIALLSTTGWAQYTLEDDYTSGGDFFDKFTFWDQADPTNGCVDYVDHGSAQQANLTKISNGQVYIGVDHDTKSPSNGRESVRLTSTKSYNSGLVILDLEHMPSSACGSWPAFWMVGPDWPSNGEIGENNASFGIAKDADMERHHRGRQRPDRERHDPTHWPWLQYLEGYEHARPDLYKQLRRQR